MHAPLTLLMRRNRAAQDAAVLVLLASAVSVAAPARAVDESDIYGLPPVIETPVAGPAEAAYWQGAANGGGDGERAELTLEERLKQLETKYVDLQTDYSELDDKYNELDGALGRFSTFGSKTGSMKISGRIHFDHWAFPGDSSGVNAFENGDPTISPQDRFAFRRIRVGVAGNMWKNTLYKVETEMAGGNDFEFRDVYIGVTDLPVFHTVLVGNQKRPYGLDHLNSSRFNVFLERPFVIEGFNQDARRLGLASYGVSEDEAWNWRFGGYNQRLVQDEGEYVSDHYQMEFAGRLANTFWYDETTDGRGYGHWALSGTYADPDGSGLPGRATNEARFRTRPEARSSNRWLDTSVIAGAEDYELVGFENVWNFGAVQVVGEYLNLFLQRRNDADVHLHGGYVYVAYFLTGEHVPWDRESGTIDRVTPFENFFLVDTCCDGVQGGWGAWQVAYRWSYADFTDENVLGGVGESHTVALNWHWNPYAKIQFNAIYGEIDDHAPVAGQTFGRYTILGTRFVCDF